MRLRSSAQLNHLWRRLPRFLAGSVAALAELSPGRALVALTMTMGFGTTAFVAVAAVGGPARHEAGPAVLGHRPTATVSRDAERTEPDAGSIPADQQEADQSQTVRPPEPRRKPPRATQRPARPSPSGTAGAPSAASVTPSPDSAAATTPAEGDTSGEPADGSPPETTVTAEYPDSDGAVFSFGRERSASYECSLDGAAYTPCEPPVSLSGLHPGWHIFAVRALDENGSADPSPATVRWHADRGSSDRAD